MVNNDSLRIIFLAAQAMRNVFSNPDVADDFYVFGWLVLSVFWMSPFISSMIRFVE